MGLRNVSWRLGYAFGIASAAELSGDRRFELGQAEIAMFNPNTRTCPAFKHQRDVDVALRIYSKLPVFVDESRTGSNPLGLRFRQGLFDVTSCVTLVPNS